MSAMLMLDANAVLYSLDFPTMVDEMHEMHRHPEAMVDELLMESVDATGNVNHFFLRTGWQPEEAVGAKVITIFPRNNESKIRPSIQAVYILFEGQYGTPVACLDGTALTYVKTAADSALGARLLARENMDIMLMIGAGEMAYHLITAHCQTHQSISKVFIWNRTMEKAHALCQGDLKQRFPRISFEPADSIETAVPEADLICSATAATNPLIPGKFLKTGCHVDLIGSYTPQMREADDDCFKRASVFVDSRSTTIHHTGELMLPLANKVISETDIKAELAELCKAKHRGRDSNSEITLFKNGGGGHLDLMVARIIYKHNNNQA